METVNAEECEKISSGSSSTINEEDDVKGVHEQDKKRTNIN